MIREIDYQGIKVQYSVDGEGPALLFIHGYLESLEIWKGFISRFKEHKVICIDIPGHGKSGILGPVHEMSEMARVAGAVLDAEEIENVVVIGHSMGGYVTTEFARIFPSRTRGYCLFHSTCFADNEEKKKNRDREISLVMCGKKMQIIHTNIPKAFADSNITDFKNETERAKQIAAANPDDGIIALLQGMKNRKDHSDFLSSNEPPALIIWGRLDNYIGEEVYRKMSGLAPHASFVILEKSGHMGFIEEPDRAYSGIMEFLSTI